jgi:hypothetical protein
MLKMTEKYLRSFRNILGDLEKILEIVGYP